MLALILFLPGLLLIVVSLLHLATGRRSGLLSAIVTLLGLVMLFGGPIGFILGLFALCGVRGTVPRRTPNQPRQLTYR